MLIWGISQGFHDAGLTVLDDNQILFASHSERYSGIKHDKNLCDGIIDAALEYGYPDHVAYYEKPWLKRLRQIYTGEPKTPWCVNKILHSILPKDITEGTGTKSYLHHHTHAAAGFQTSPYNNAIVVVADAIGEWDTTSIWYAHYDKKGHARYKKLWSRKYPHSIGLFYSAVTGAVGLRPMDEEYILMGMAGWGKHDNHLHCHMKEFWADRKNIKLAQNLHTGIEPQFFAPFAKEDVAYSAQKVVSRVLDHLFAKAKNYNFLSENLVYMGGVALNCSYNSNLTKYFKNTWIMPNPGDCGSSLGAAALTYGKKLDWQNPYLGQNIAGAYPVKNITQHLLDHKIAGVANGRAEFGPRALGNRSLLADPRGPEIKDAVNEIKRRQKFRPFAPVILEEHASRFFEMPYSTSPYMQYTAKCLYPEVFPAIVHVDGTSRVQTVNKNCGSGIRQLLEHWYEQTGCPMLLNTSLNIRGKPMVNNVRDALAFENLYNVRVFTKEDK